MNKYIETIETWHSDPEIIRISKLLSQGMKLWLNERESFFSSVTPYLPENINCSYTIRSVRINMGVFYEACLDIDGSSIPIAWANNYGCMTVQEFKNMVRSEYRTDYLSDFEFANFREPRLGNTAPNIIFRSCHPAINEGDMASRSPYSASLGEQSKIATVINLADRQEELLVHGTEKHWYSSFITQKKIIGLSMGMEYKKLDFKSNIKTCLEFMLKHNPPYLIHCIEGKDRTGIVIALLGALMGASADTIVDDYMLSFVNYFGFVKGEERYNMITGVMYEFLEDINEGIVPITEETAERYLMNVIGITSTQINSLRLKLA